MGKTSVRLSQELSKRLESEVKKVCEIGGKTITISDLIRACIEQNFSQVSAKIMRENASVAELKEEVLQLRERYALLAQDVEKLVQTLSEMFPLLATREQVDALTDGIAAVIRTVKGR